jgi:hypothetical protein
MKKVNDLEEINPNVRTASCSGGKGAIYAVKTDMNKKVIRK